jgi:hypothetical protein
VVDGYLYTAGLRNDGGILRPLSTGIDAVKGPQTNKGKRLNVSLTAYQIAQKSLQDATSLVRYQASRQSKGGFDYWCAIASIV